MASYPNVPIKTWWLLRKQFLQTMPNQITPSYLVAVLGGKERSVKGNVLSPLKALGLVGDDGRPTDRAKLWRDDTRYPEVCHEIREELYPAELRDALPGPEIDQEVAIRWFMSDTGRGQQAAAKMARMYSLLTAADPSGGDEVKPSKPRRRRRAGSKKQPQPAPPPDDPSKAGNQSKPQNLVTNLGMPEMRLNVEIRIDASVTPEQIEMIFASMAKHLYHRYDEGR